MWEEGRYVHNSVNFLIYIFVLLILVPSVVQLLQVYHYTSVFDLNASCTYQGFPFPERVFHKCL